MATPKSDGGPEGLPNQHEVRSDASPMDVESADVCWICLEGEEDTRGKLQTPCKCPRKAHAQCLARWQLQQAGRSEETQCRFCGAILADWKESLTPVELKPEVQKVQPIMVVYFEGEIHRIPVRQGDEGLKEFTARIRELFKLPAEVDISLTFGCKEPMSGHHLKLEGMGAFDAAVHCASVAAAERQHKAGQRAAKGKGGEPDSSDDGEDTTDLLQSTLGGPIQRPPAHRQQYAAAPPTRMQNGSSDRAHRQPPFQQQPRGMPPMAPMQVPQTPRQLAMPQATAAPVAARAAVPPAFHAPPLSRFVPPADFMQGFPAPDWQLPNPMLPGGQDGLATPPARAMPVPTRSPGTPLAPYINGLATPAGMPGSPADLAGFGLNLPAPSTETWYPEIFSNRAHGTMQPPAAPPPTGPFSGMPPMFLPSEHTPVAAGDTMHDMRMARRTASRHQPGQMLAPVDSNASATSTTAMECDTLMRAPETLLPPGLLGPHAGSSSSHDAIAGTSMFRANPGDAAMLPRGGSSGGGSKRGSGGGGGALNYDVPPNVISRSKLNQVLSFFGIRPPSQYTLGSTVQMDD